MGARRQPQTEQEYWEAIEGFGGIVWGLNHDLADERIEDNTGAVAKDVAKMQKTLERLAKEACEKFGIVHPQDYPKDYHPGQELPPLPEGKRIHYWDWYRSMRNAYFLKEYNSLICSACPLSEGSEKFISLGGTIPCSVFHGVIYKLVTPFACAMTNSSKDWSRERLLNEIHAKGGHNGLAVFLEKETQLKASTGNPL